MKSTDHRRQTTVSKSVLKFPFGESLMLRTIMNQLLLPWIILTFCFIGCSHSQPSLQLNRVAVNGSAVRLNCSSETYEDVKWSFQNLSNVYTIYDKDIDEKFKDQYSVEDSDKGHFDLSFTASEKTSGTYICVAANKSFQPFVFARVSVFDGKATCSGEEASGYVKANCSIGFSGFFTPVLEWSNVNGKLEPNRTDGPTHLISRITSTVIVPINSTDSRASCILTCTPKVALGNTTGDVTTKNILEFPESCTPEIRPPGHSLIGKSSPLNYAAAEGTPVHLNCSAPTDVFGNWSYKNPVLSVHGDDLRIYNGEEITDRFKNMFWIDASDKGRFQLAFILSKNTSGRYTCVPFISSERTSGTTCSMSSEKAENAPENAQVIVLDGRPTCSEEYTSDFFMANCSIGFSGYWPPELEWSNAKRKKGITYTKTTNNSRVTSHIIVPFNKNESEGSFVFKCTPKFTLKNKPPGTTAQNIPKFPFSCSTTGSDGAKLLLPLSSVTVSLHNGHDPCLRLCLLVTLVFIKLSQKWLWQ